MSDPFFRAHLGALWFQAARKCWTTHKLNGRTIIVLAHDDPKTLLTDYAYKCNVYLQRIKTNYDAIKPDERGTVLSSLLLSILCHRLNVSVNKYAIDKEHASLLQKIVRDFDEMIDEANEFIAEKCKDNKQLLDRVTMDLGEASYTFMQKFSSYLQING